MAVCIRSILVLMACCWLVETVERGFVYCPAYPCTCESKDGALIINCRSLYLSTLPKFLSFDGRIQELSLRHNSINSLPAKGFQNMHVEKLDLLDNAVTFIHKDAFAGLEDSLRWFSVQLYAMDGFPVIPLSRLRRLRTLIIVGCKQRTLHPNLFSNLSMLEELRLVGCRIAHVQLGTFRPLPLLTTLVLSENSLTYQSLAEINVIEKLVYLDLSFNDIQLLNNSTFFRLSKLRSLNMAANNLSQIKKEAFYNLDFSLEELNLRDNNINENDLQSLTNLKILRQLDLSFNNINDLTGRYFVSLRYLLYLNIAHNNIRVINRGNLRGLSSVVELDMGNNPLFKLESRALSDLDGLRRLNMNNTNLGGNIGLQTFSWAPSSLTHLDMSYSSLVSADFQGFSRLSNITHLDLNHNLITDLDFNVLMILSQLQFANFSYNNISTISNNYIFHFNSSLKFLDLSWNYIQTIKNCSFSSFTELREFRLDGNPLTCNCSLSWLYRWLQVSQVNIIPDSKWTCSFPASLEGFYISELEFSDFQCSNSSDSDDACPVSDSTERTSENTTKVNKTQKEVTSICRPICVNVSRLDLYTVHLQWQAEDARNIYAFNITLKSRNDSSVLETKIVSANTTDYTLITDTTTEQDICVVSISKELTPLAETCLLVPSHDSKKDEESRRQQLHNLLHNSFLPLMFIYISGSLALAFIGACIVVVIRRKRASPRRVKPLCVAYPGWLDHGPSAASSTMTHDPRFLNTLFIDNASSRDALDVSNSTMFTERLPPNGHCTGTDLPFDFPVILPDRRESGAENTGTGCSTLTTQTLTRPAEAGDEFFFHF